MSDDKQLDHLIGVLYESVLDPGRLQEALGLCGHYAGGLDAQLVIRSKPDFALINSVLAETQFPHEALQDYVNYYINIDPRLSYIGGGKPGEWRFCQDICDEQFAQKNEFYQDFLIRYESRFVMAACIDEDDSRHIGLGVLRGVGQQPFADEQRLAAERFSGHLRTALRLQNHTQQLQSKIQLGAMAIDALEFGMLIVDSNGYILHLNSNADDLINNPDCELFVKDSHITIGKSAAKQKLAALLSEATAVPALAGAMVLKSNQSHTVRQMIVTPLSPASPLAGDWQKPLALVLVLEPGALTSPLTLLAKLYNFSPSEVRIAASIVAGHSPKECAATAGVSVNTVRTQLKSLMLKTDTHKQSELVALLSRLPPLKG
jgi:DNA-binding CsgD family transcriptional regulator